MVGLVFSIGLSFVSAPAEAELIPYEKSLIHDALKRGGLDPFSYQDLYLRLFEDLRSKAVTLTDVERFLEKNTEAELTVGAMTHLGLAGFGIMTDAGVAFRASNSHLKPGVSIGLGVGQTGISANLGLKILLEEGMAKSNLLFPFLIEANRVKPLEFIRDEEGTYEMKGKTVKIDSRGWYIAGPHASSLKDGRRESTGIAFGFGDFIESARGEFGVYLPIYVPRSVALTATYYRIQIERAIRALYFGDIVGARTSLRKLEGLLDFRNQLAPVASRFDTTGRYPLSTITDLLGMQSRIPSMPKVRACARLLVSLVTGQL